jgi:uncharacterized membrane protein
MIFVLFLLIVAICFLALGFANGDVFAIILAVAIAYWASQDLEQAIPKHPFPTSIEQTNQEN